MVPAILATAVSAAFAIAVLPGAGTRDFAVAATIVGSATPAAAAVPLVYGGLLFLGAALLVFLRHRTMGGPEEPRRT